jgi:hypothetical protein
MGAGPRHWLGARLHLGQTTHDLPLYEGVWLATARNKV